MYKGEPKLQFDLLEEIAKKVQIPLVLHGGSGTPEDQVLKAIDYGIRKINVNTEISLTAVSTMADTVKENQQVHLSTLMTHAQEQMTIHMEKIIRLYQNK